MLRSANVPFGLALPGETARCDSVSTGNGYVNGQAISQGMGCRPITDKHGAGKIVNQWAVGAHFRQPCGHRGCDLVSRHPGHMSVMQTVGQLIDRGRRPVL